MRDGEDFDAFYAAWGPRLTRSIYLSTGDLTRAQDAVQEAFIRAWQRWPMLGAGKDEPTAWVRTVAWRLASNDWRRVVRQAKAVARISPTQEPATPSEDVMAVRDALARLPEPQRMVLVLYYYEDLSVQRISEVLRVPQGTVKARLSRARAGMAGYLILKEEESWEKNDRR